MWPKTRTLIVVVAVTLLVWVLTDLALTGNLTDKALQYRLADPVDSPLIVELVQPADGKLVASFRGSTARINTLASRIATGQFPRPLQIDPNTPVGLRTLSAAQTLGQSFDKDLRGISIARVTPGKIVVKVDKWIRPTVKVSRLEAGSFSAQQVQFEPAEVKITIRHSVWESIAPKHRVLVGRITPGEIAAPADGDKVTVRARLVPQIAGHPVKLLTDTVRAVFHVETTQVRDRLLGISVLYPAQWLREYELVVENKDALKVDLEVEGPPELIESLKAGKLPVAVVLPFTLEDIRPRTATDGPIVREPKVILPAGVKLIRQPEPVRFFLRKRGGG